MKKTCICLLLVICAVYLKQGYEIMASGDPVNNFTSGSLSDIAEEVIAIPLETNNRFLISTYYNANTADNNYIFCFDQREKHSYTMKGGFEDNFYQTGQVAELQSMDIYNTSYCYYKTGEELKKAFPDRKDGDNPVLFIVKLKG